MSLPRGKPVVIRHTVRVAAGGHWQGQAVCLPVLETSVSSVGVLLILQYLKFIL